METYVSVFFMSETLGIPELSHYTVLKGKSGEKEDCHCTYSYGSDCPYCIFKKHRHGHAADEC